MSIEYTLDAQDVASARLLAIGIRPRTEFALFALALAGLLAVSVSRWNFGSLPLLIGLTASLGAFRLMQINKVKHEATSTFNRNPTLRRATVASWDAEGITVQPLAYPPERIVWAALEKLKENERIVLFQQRTGALHAVPKRAFSNKAAVTGFLQDARAGMLRAARTGRDTGTGTGTAP